MPIYIEINETMERQICVLIKESYLDQLQIRRAYLNHLPNTGVLIMGLPYNGKKALPATERIDFFKKEVFPYISPDMQIIIADSEYGKTFCKLQKVTNIYGDRQQCQIPEYGAYDNVWIVPNYAATAYNSTTQSQIDYCLEAINANMLGTIVSQDIIKYSLYLKDGNNTLAFIKLLASLHVHPALTVDIEATGLKFYKDTITTISFAWNQHEGVCSVVTPQYLAALRSFFETYKGKLIAHKAGFDFKFLIYHLWMSSLADTEGLITGMNVLTKNFDDTLLLTYLATNNTVKNALGLKENSREFAGNYGLEDDELLAFDPNNCDEYLEYNLKDSLCTWYVRNKYSPIVDADNQREIYETLFKPGVRYLLQTEITGLPVDPIRVQEVKKELTAVSGTALRKLKSLKTIGQFTRSIREEYREFRNSKLKNKVLEYWEAARKKKFNPNSGPQLQQLLYEVMQLPVLDLTDTKQPSVGNKTLKKLRNHTDNPEYKEIINLLLDYLKVDKILSTFIPALEDAVHIGDGEYRLYGNFNLGGTISGRLSSNSPNLQNIPSSGELGKLIKSCFRSTKLWLFGGADYKSLEDRINTVLTRDPNKEKIYLEGYCGHCFRTYYYWPDAMPDIVNTVESINSIEERYPTLRNKSKAPSFALQYFGTHYTLMQNCGFPKEEALQIESNYHKLYEVSINWANAQLDQAHVDGYVTLAFGLRLRTPLLAKYAIHPTGRYPNLVAAERRSAGNAVTGQSYGLLNLRTGIEVQKAVLASEYKHDILPCASIHDAAYYLIKPDINAIKYLNDHLIEEMNWQDLEPIRHPTIGLGGALDMFYPTWGNALHLPNNASSEELFPLLRQHIKDNS